MEVVGLKPAQTKQVEVIACFKNFVLHTAGPEHFTEKVPSANTRLAVLLATRVQPVVCLPANRSHLAQVAHRQAD